MASQEAEEEPEPSFGGAASDVPLRVPPLRLPLEAEPLREPGSDSCQESTRTIWPGGQEWQQYSGGDDVVDVSSDQHHCSSSITFDAGVDLVDWQRSSASGNVTPSFTSGVELAEHRQGDDMAELGASEVQATRCQCSDSGDVVLAPASIDSADPSEPPRILPAPNLSSSSAEDDDEGKRSPGHSVTTDTLQNMSDSSAARVGQLESPGRGKSF